MNDDPTQPPIVIVEAPTPTPPASLTDDLANVLTIVQRVFVGQCDVRREIARVLDRYADEELVKIEQLTADRAMRDRYGIPLALREAITLDSLAIDPICGF